MVSEIGVKTRRKREFVQVLSTAELVLMLTVGKEDSRKTLFVIHRVNVAGKVIILLFTSESG